MIPRLRHLSAAIVVAIAATAQVGTITAAPPATARADRPTLIVVVGAPGDDEYGEVFAEEVKQWRDTAAAAEATLHVIGDAPAASTSDKDRLLKLLGAEPRAATEPPLWLVLIGHGTFDGRTAAFNLRGPDLSPAELSTALAEMPRPTVIVNTTAASAPFLTALSAPGRAVVTATKSGQERNYARFGRYFARRVADPAADLDKDDQTSLFEAFLSAARDTAEFYEGEGRIATEHPLLDDDGDGRGVRFDFFQRGRLVKRPAGEAAADGDFARRLHLKSAAADRSLSPDHRTTRDQLEAELAQLRLRKTTLLDAEYFIELERILVALARLYDDANER